MKNGTHVDRTAAAVREVLPNLGVSNREVAREAGVAPATVAKIRAGSPVRPDRLYKVAKVVLHHEPGPPRVWAVPTNGLPELVAS